MKHALLAAATILLVGGNIHAGVLDILRGEPAAPPARRVAFIGSAVVREVSGTVERLTGIDEWNSLPAAANLLPGEIIRTKEGTVLLRMAESQSFVKVTPNTTLRLVPIEPGWDRSSVSGREERTGFIVRSCRGKAFVNGEGEGWKPVEVNELLARGTFLRTQPGTVLDLFHTGTKRPLRIRGSTEVKLDEAILARRVIFEQNFAAAAR